MIRLLTIVLLVCTSSAALSTTLYRWVDEDGRVHFSDQPREGAEQVTVRSPSTFEGQSTTAKRPAARNTDSDEEAFAYDSLQVVSPASEQTLWNLEGKLTVSIAVSPGLGQGHTLQATVDGRSITVGNATSFTVDEVYRGEHNVSVSVVDARGRELIRSPTVKFFVQQTSINN